MKKTICKPLELISKQDLTTGVFLSGSRKSNIVSCYEKDGKQNLKNYRPDFLFPICREIFERIIFNEMFGHGPKLMQEFPKDLS